MEKISISGDWKKYGEKQAVVLTAEKECFGQLELAFSGSISIDLSALAQTEK